MTQSFLPSQKPETPPGRGVPVRPLPGAPGFPHGRAKPSRRSAHKSSGPQRGRVDIGPKGVRPRTPPRDTTRSGDLASRQPSRAHHLDPWAPNRVADVRPSSSPGERQSASQAGERCSRPQAGRQLELPDFLDVDAIDRFVRSFQLALICFPTFFVTLVINHYHGLNTSSLSQGIHHIRLFPGKGIF